MVWGAKSLANMAATATDHLFEVKDAVFGQQEATDDLLNASTPADRW